jgi:phage shock protein PspC (stress-responsive transcriptional regulator)
LLENSAFGKRFQLGPAAVDCLIVFFMVLWFLGALMLFVITTGFQKDRYPVRSYSY